MPFPRFRERSIIVALASLVLLPAIASSQSAVISGHVTAAASGEPLPESRVVVIGTTLFASTNATGQYTIRGVPAGTFEIRVLRVGYAEQKKPITLSAGQNGTLDFAMATVVVKLQEVVTTATGEQRRVELGNNVANIDAATRTQNAPVTDVASLLVGQAAGVQVMPGNTTGTGARIRIRGTNSLSLVNDPIYIIDGVRMTSPNGSQSGNIFTGGAIQSRAQDINPDEIENIEIVKGPSAATLYGTDAANGVIVITTKRGRAGATQYNVFGEEGAIHDYNTWPTAYTLLGHTAAAPTTPIRCTLSTVSAGTCLSDSLAKFNLFKDPFTTPLGTGSRKNAGLQVSGGSDVVRFFTSGEYEDEIGVLKIPEFDVRRLDTTGVNILQEWRQPNEMTRSTMRANLNATPSPKLDLAISSGFIHLMTRLPQSDNNALGLLSNGFGGPGFANPGPGYTDVST
ncbi:MAG TPA: carboxypeptidase regulatory-like domain-containing protein, partial [Gemmatimonadaceae bacterium]|nr:carboxypeptidase regulatory-like domain-containing protein [Gemmatimonadaceae bacterium]